MATNIAVMSFYINSFVELRFHPYNKTVFFVTGGGMLNIGYSFGEGENIFCYPGCEVQYAAFFFKRLMYSIHGGVGVRF